MPNYQQFIDYLFAKSTNAGIPLSGTFELTSRCNLDCRMCYIHKRANDPAALREELPAADWIRLAENAQRAGMLLLLLTGGEPLLRSDFPEIYTACRRLGLLVSVNTNGTRIDEDVIALWKKYPPLRVNLTLYGAKPESYRRLCGHEDAYMRAYRAVDLLCKAGIRCKLNFSATPENLDDLPEIFAFAKERDLPLQVASYMFPPRTTAFALPRRYWQSGSAGCLRASPCPIRTTSARSCRPSGSAAVPVPPHFGSPTAGKCARAA